MCGRGRAERAGSVWALGNGVVVAGAVEGGVEVEAVADVADDDERRAAGRSCARSRAPARRRRCMSTFQAGVSRLVLPALWASSLGGLLGLQDEAAFLVQVDAADGDWPVFVNQLGLALEDVGVFLGVALGRVGARDVQHVAEVVQEGVLVGPLGRAGRGPFLHERFKRLRHHVAHRS